MKEKLNKIRIAYLKEYRIEDIIERHIELVTQPKKIIVNAEDISMSGLSFNPKYEIIRQAKSAPRKSVLYHKYIFLISLILQRCMNNKYRTTTLYYNVMEDVLGKHYYDMLDTLSDMNIILRGSQYIVGKHSKTITLINGTIGYQYTQNVKVAFYYNKMHILINREKEKNISNYRERLFVSNYNESLSFLSLDDKKGALQLIEEREFKSKESKDYYQHKINFFEEDKITIQSIDKNKRIYHYLTNLPKDLKRFFNIKYQCDIHNSHPLIFSLFLIRKYNIDKYILENLLNINAYNNHYVRQQLRKILADKNLQNKVATIPIDVFNYIYVTCKGTFWDVFLDIINNNPTYEKLDRRKIKVTLFREVFYSHRFKSTRNKPFAKLFKKLYPNVWKVIKDIKVEKGTNVLPNMMMQEESKLFRIILERCYERNWKVVNIHDAIIVFDVEANQFNINELIEIMQKVYNENGLYPNISVEMYNKKKDSRN